MRQDQYEKLQDLTEKLTDAFIGEADPAVWPGSGVAIAAMDQQTRGDRYWCKKNAAATLSVIVRTTTLLGTIRQHTGFGGPGGVPEPEQDKEDIGLDAEVRAAEKEAEMFLKKLQKDGMTKAHGK